jgi:hypothetical protein
MKEEALKLADELEALHQYVPSEAPAMIRRLVEQYVDKNEKHRHEPVAYRGYDTQQKKWRLYLKELAPPNAEPLYSEYEHFKEMVAICVHCAKDLGIEWEDPDERESKESN